MNNAKQNTIRPPGISFLFAVLAAIGIYMSYRYSQLGMPFAAPVAIVASVYMSFQLVRGCNDQSKVNAYRRGRNILKDNAMHHGKARLATNEELKREGLVGKGNKGIFLGSVDGEHLTYNGDLSGNIVGAPGSGKTSCVLVNSLLSSRANTAEENENARSWIINDPDLQAYAVCSNHLKKNGYDVAVASSWTDDMSNRLGVTIDDVGIDIFQNLDPETVNPSIIRDECKLRIQLAIPLEKPGTDEKEKFFRRGSRIAVEIPTLLECSEGRKPNLVNLHSYLMSSPAELNELFIKCMESSYCGGYLAKIASSMSGVMNSSPEQFAGYLGVAFNALESYSPGSAVGRHVSKPGLDTRVFKNEDKPFALFVSYPGRYGHTNQQMLNMEFSYLFEMVCADPRRRRVTALIDEAASLGYVPSLLRFLNEGRKHNLSIFNFYQEIFGQAAREFGREGMIQIFSAGAVNWFSDVREKETCKIISDLAGTRAFEDVSINNRSQSSQDPNDQTFSLSNRSAPMFRDLRTELRNDEALIVYKNLPVIKAKKVPYYLEPQFADVAGKDPFEN